MITGNQIRAARALVDIGQEELAAAAKITRQTLVRMEASGAEPVVGKARTLQAVLTALEVNGAMVVPGGVILCAPLGSPLVNRPVARHR
jgi:DNA-binding XRE family transcriptional regulator